MHGWHLVLEFLYFKSLFHFSEFILKHIKLRNLLFCTDSNEFFFDISGKNILNWLNVNHLIKFCRLLQETFHINSKNLDNSCYFEIHIRHTNQATKHNNLTAQAGFLSNHNCMLITWFSILKPYFIVHFTLLN